MERVIVELIEGYFVEIDSLNHTLKKRYIGKNKNTGEDKQSEKIIGYYKNLPDCIERLVRLIPIDENDNTAITLSEYAEASERAFKRVEELSKKLAVGNDGWIPCSEKLPEEDVLEDGYVEPSEAVLVFTKYNSYKVSRYWGNRRNKRDYHDWVDIKYRKNEVIAWKHIAPYQTKGE